LLPLKNCSVDIILSTSTLDHFNDKQSFLRSIQELSRVLKPDGTLILILDNKKYLFRWLHKLKYRLGVVPFFIGQTYSLRELDGFLHQAQLHRVNATAIVHSPVNVFTHLFRFGSAVLGKYMSSLLRFGEKLLSMLPLRFITGTYIAVQVVKKEMQ
jgi:SAM-dependent methyltransferase